MVDTVILYIQQSHHFFYLKNNPGVSPDLYNLKIGCVASTAITAAVD